MKNQLSPEVLQNICLVATDMDGTLTQKGKLISGLISALESLLRTNIDIVIVTGRSAGWVNGLTNYLPIQGAIAERSSEYQPLLRSLTI